MAIQESADYLVEVHSPADVIDALTSNPTKHLPLVVGEGSNMILAGPLPMPVILNRIKGIEAQAVDQDVLVRVGAGENWHQFLMYAIKQGWHGLENLSLIPGTVGAAPVQNIGAYGVEIERCLESVSYIDMTTLQQRILTKSECNFGYRDSIFKRALKGKACITQVEFRFKADTKPVLTYGPLQDLAARDHLSTQDIANEVIRIRESKLPDPNQLPNAGSFFKNPVVSVEQFESLRIKMPDIVYYQVEGGIKLAAGWIIDHLGWKGRTLGPVAVHDRQALVLVNHGGRGEDVLKLAQAIQKDVFAHFSIELEIEPQIFGIR